MREAERGGGKAGEVRSGGGRDHVGPRGLFPNQRANAPHFDYVFVFVFVFHSPKD